jgi:hypothetical protein
LNWIFESAFLFEKSATIPLPSRKYADGKIFGLCFQANALVWGSHLLVCRSDQVSVAGRIKMDKSGSANEHTAMSMSKGPKA